MNSFFLDNEAVKYVIKNPSALHFLEFNGGAILCYYNT